MTFSEHLATLGIDEKYHNTLHELTDGDAECLPDIVHGDLTAKGLSPPVARNLLKKIAPPPAVPPPAVSPGESGGVSRAPEAAAAAAADAVAASDQVGGRRRRRPMPRRKPSCQCG